MIKSTLKNRYVRKLTVFSAVFLIAVGIMGGTLANMYEYDNPARPVADIQAYIPETPVPTTLLYLGEFEEVIEAAEQEPVEAEEDIADIPAGDYEEGSKINRDFAYCSDIPLSEELQRFTYDQCMTQELDYELVLAVMWRESRFEVDAVNVNIDGTSDSGIMQINDVNREWLEDELGITDLLNPEENIIAGTTLLGKLTRKYGTHKALLAYQYGETGMAERLEQGMTTNSHVQLVYDKKQDFEHIISQVAGT